MQLDNPPLQSRDGKALSQLMIENELRQHCFIIEFNLLQQISSTMTEADDMHGGRTTRLTAAAISLLAGLAAGVALARQRIWGGTAAPISKNGALTIPVVGERRPATAGTAGSRRRHSSPVSIERPAPFACPRARSRSRSAVSPGAVATMSFVVRQWGTSSRSHSSYRRRLPRTHSRAFSVPAG